MREDEARSKWCPHVRAILGTIQDDGRSRHANEQPVFNRIVDEGSYAFPTGAACLASACMSWRWRTPPRAERRVEFKETETDSPARPPAPPAGEGWVLVKKQLLYGNRQWARFRRTVPAEPGDGYCGLAGPVPADEPTS